MYKPLLILAVVAVCCRSTPLAAQSPSVEQRITALISGSMYLCPLYYNDEMVRGGEGADDFLQRITATVS